MERQVCFVFSRETFMPTYTQDGRPLSITTPLGKDILLLVGFNGTEAMSQLFHFQLDVLAENKTDVPFDKLLGQKVSAALTLPDDKTQRYFSGICRARHPGRTRHLSPPTGWRSCRRFWLLTRRTQSRIFQHVTVPDILKKVLRGSGRRRSSSRGRSSRATTACSTARPTSTSPAG